MDFTYTRTNTKFERIFSLKQNANLMYKFELSGNGSTQERNNKLK